MFAFLLLIQPFVFWSMCHQFTCSTTYSYFDVQSKLRSLFSSFSLQIQPWSSKRQAKDEGDSNSCGCHCRSFWGALDSLLPLQNDKLERQYYFLLTTLELISQSCVILLSLNHFGIDIAELCNLTSRIVQSS